MEDPGVDGRIFGKWNVGVWTGSIFPNALYRPHQTRFIVSAESSQNHRGSVPHIRYGASPTCLHCPTRAYFNSGTIAD
jgi:hypothetical protein